MPLPTLLREGIVKINSNASSEEKKKAETLKAKDFITWKFFDSRIGKAGKDVSDRIFILKSGTGSGKTKTLAPDFFEKYGEQDRRKISLLQPTTLVAIESAKDIDSIYKDLKMGDTIGYSTGSAKKPARRGVNVSVYDTLLLQLKNNTDEDIIKMYSLVIVDEVHTRNLSIDLILYYMKNLIKRNINNPLCPFLVIMSATFSVYDYLDYFECDLLKNYIEVPGTTPFPVKDIYLERSTTKYTTDGLRIIKEIDKTIEGIPNNIIIFEPSISMSTWDKDIMYNRLDIFNEMCSSC